MTNATFNTLTTHQYPKTNNTIRTTKKQDGTVWFSVDDVCRATNITVDQILKDIEPGQQAVFIFHSDGNSVEIDMVSATRLLFVAMAAKTDPPQEFYAWAREEMLDLGDINSAEKKDNQVVSRAFTFRNSKDHEIRTIIKGDGSVWFVAKDVCDTLEYTRTRNALRILDDDEKGAQNMSTPGGSQEVSIISESGLYTLVLRSNKPEAKKFRKWVTSEVLPQIRRTGAYQVTENAPAPCPVPAPDSLTPVISRKAITAFLQSATDTFWEVEAAINEFEAMRLNLRKAKKDISRVIRSIKQAFPDISETVDMVGGRVSDSGLEIEVK